MKDGPSFSENFRWLLPILVGILTLVIAQQNASINNLVTEQRALRIEIAESRKFSITYTDKMIDLVIHPSERRK